MTVEIQHDEPAAQYALLVDGAAVSVLGYQRHGDTVVVLHTATEVEQRGRGYASRLVDEVLARLEDEGASVVLRCPFARARVAGRAGAGG